MVIEHLLLYVSGDGGAERNEILLCPAGVYRQ